MQGIDLSEFGIVSAGTVQAQPATATSEPLEIEGITIGEVVRIPQRSKGTRTSSKAEVRPTFERAPASTRRICMSEPHAMTCTVCGNTKVHIIYKDKGAIVGCIKCRPGYITKNWSVK